MHVAVQVPAYRESGTIAGVLSSINEQRVPGTVDVGLEAWVTPHPDRGRCSTWSEATSVPGVSVHEAPSGKLSARNVAHRHAVDEGADVIVTWDADAPPRHSDVLAELVNPFERPGVVATNSKPLSPPTVLGLVTNTLGRFEDTVRPHMHGQLSAFTSDAWEAAGPFDESLDQTDVTPVRQEEEFDFYHRLDSLGEVAYCPEAVVMNHTRRAECMIGARNDEFCRRRGTETFHPARRD